MENEKGWTQIASTDELNVCRNQFWQAIWIWNVKPNVVNRRLFACEILHCFELPDPSSHNFFDIDINYDGIQRDQLENVIIHRIKEKLSVQECDESHAHLFSSKNYFLLKRIHLRNQKFSDFLEICFINYTENCIVHYPICYSTELENLPALVFPLMLKFELGRILANVLPHWKESVNYEKLRFILLPKLSKWAESADSKDIFEVESDSLKLIPVNSYNELYLHWKDKYGQHLVENWTESTDPSKFVYEDVGIAVYLSLLWRNEKVNFVDLGCGNGLLVHILTEEGHKGRGIDIRPRKIWDLYKPPATLEVGVVSPADNWKYPEADWIIGNHSDELTPWIPVFAAGTSYKCNFFLLPCCAFEFNGKRYQRKNSAVSSYNDYIEYVRKISTELGFDVKVDRLRIPSTKRICLVGDQRTYSVDSYGDILKERIEPIFHKYSSASEKDNFIPRESVEKVRNCTKVDRSVTCKIDKIISEALIKKQLSVIQKKKNISDIWSEDYSISFKEAISLLDSKDLKQLKNECGGLKTLLRNNHSVYIVQNGRILFRKPSEKIKSSKWKNRPCWFFHDHPLSCPLPENKCSFIH